MKHSDPSLNKSLAADWQIIGELELPVGSNADNKINAWLTEVINPLGLRADFLNKVLRSAQEAATRAMQAEAVVKFEHTHLLIFAPKDRASTGQTWGFFRIEKVGTAADDHSIEFYLYLE